MCTRHNILQATSAAIFSLLFVLLTVFCSSKKLLKEGESLVYDIASKTTRRDIVTQTAISLSGFNFTIQYATTEDSYFGVKTEWRLQSQVFSESDDAELIQIRDRAILRLSSRGFQGRDESLVASKVEFEMQIQVGDGKWSRIDPFSALKQEYQEIVEDIRKRLHHKGYIF